jgi:signal transduction histidine kinase/CheY-like chemotaxis protein
MSHELRTPLNSLLILAQLLAENKPGNLTDKQVEYAQTIHSAGSDLLMLINDILDISKVEAGKMKIHLEPFYLTELVDMMNQKFQPQAQKKGLAFQIQIAEEVPSFINTDVQRLQQILNNLLSNAFKFTQEGEVRLEIQLVGPHPSPLPEGEGSGPPPPEGVGPHPSPLPEGEGENLRTLGDSRGEGLPPRPLGEGRGEGQPPRPLGEGRGEGHHLIAFSVTDTGIGIPKEKQQVIFEAFQQVDGTTSRRYGGTGLGLSISRQLARLLGGEIRLSSELDQGSTFTLYLPNQSAITVSSSPESPSEIATTAPVASETVETENPLMDDRESFQPEDKIILIIENDRKFATILMEVAREKAFKCLIAEEGKTGLQLIEQYQPHAIILDIGLPARDGWTVMERLKKPDMRHIPVHLISTAESSIKAKKMGAVDYLQKPVNMEQLSDALNQIEQFMTKTVKTLLVIADHESHKQKILSVVEDKNVEITPAETTAAALKYLKETIFDCVILDLDIEQRTGSKLLEKMQQKEEPCQTPLIAYAEREFTPTEETLLLQCAEKLPIKSVQSAERLLDEVTLFLHQLVAELPDDKRNMLKMVHDKTLRLNQKKVLIVDDDPRNVFALATILEDYDMEVIFANNGKQALQLLEEKDNIAIVLMDIMMPEMDGYEAMRQIRAQTRFRKLPIIALTAKAMKGDKAKCIEAGANDYLSKPVDTDKLISLMRVWLYR